MENNNQNTYRVNPAIAIAVILQIIFIIFASITIHNILNQNTEAPRIKISNYSVLPAGEIIGESSNGVDQDINFTLSDAGKAIIENTIYEIASINNNGNIANHGAKIREDSARHAYIEDLNAYFLNFIVDIEDLQQSYRFAWLGGNNFSGQDTPKITSLMAFCPQEDEMIYNDFHCKDNYNGRGLDMTVYDILRYEMFNNFTVGLSGAYNDEPLKLRINTISDESSVENAAIQEVSDYLSSLGFNLDDFKYTVGSYVCCSLD